MDYYESDSPAKNESGLSGALGYNFNGQIASPTPATYQVSLSQSQQGGYGNGASNLTTYTIQVCIDGVLKNLDVYVAKPPY